MRVSHTFTSSFGAESVWDSLREPREPGKHCCFAASPVEELEFAALTLLLAHMEELPQGVKMASVGTEEAVYRSMKESVSPCPLNVRNVGIELTEGRLEK